MEKWEADVLPLNYSRNLVINILSAFPSVGVQDDVPESNLSSGSSRRAGGTSGTSTAGPALRLLLVDDALQVLGATDDLHGLLLSADIAAKD